MNFRILIPYWGNKAQYRALLDQWLVAYNSLQLPYEVTVISDRYTVRVPGVNWETFDTPEYDPTYHFDHKGDIVCAAIQRILDPVLVLTTGS